MSDMFPHSARQLFEDVEKQNEIHKEVEKAIKENNKHRNLQTAGALANIESRDQLIEQNKLVIKQLAEQTEINQRLEHEFKMGAREAVITRKIAYWSLGVGIAGIVIALIALFKR